MNQVAGPFAPAAAFGFNNASQAYYYGGGPPSTPQQQTHGARAPSQPSQAPAPPAAGYYDGGNAAIASRGGNMIPQFAGQQQRYPHTTAPYSQPVPAQVPSVAAPHPPQQHGLSHNQFASPQQRLSPNAASPAQSKQHTQSPPNRYPMAAPPLPHTPSQHQATSSIASAPSPRTPQSPGSQTREQQRVALLLDINVDLLQEVNRLQAQGKGGAINLQQQAQLKSQGQQMELAADDFIQVLRRVQAILAYLMPKAQNDQQRAPEGPAHMTPPPHMPQLQFRYDQLQALFPGWDGYDRAPSGSSASPQPNGAANGMVGAPTAGTY
ncbi:hypothetical protein LTR36_003568 [Oleoguttula mirabilis]|uniref:Uncharacterized protein n=1 Tax=Oleoguttula mirabilis TaxID=1507867 RepID=A0AAV9JJ72_9PEZI|nr:hypothetical protein LTR36_003568 [Oleoguttula mirabilis]